jgi:hypothetical protein
LAQPKPAVGAEFFTAPIQVNHRRYEALRAFFVEGMTHGPGRREVRIHHDNQRPYRPMSFSSSPREASAGCSATRTPPCPQPCAEIRAKAI